MYHWRSYLRLSYYFVVLCSILYIIFFCFFCSSQIGSRCFTQVGRGPDGQWFCFKICVGNQTRHLPLGYTPVPMSVTVMVIKPCIQRKAVVYYHYQSNEAYYDLTSDWVSLICTSEKSKLTHSGKIVQPTVRLWAPMHLRCYIKRRPFLGYVKVNVKVMQTIRQTYNSRTDVPLCEVWKSKASVSFSG